MERHFTESSDINKTQIFQSIIEGFPEFYEHTSAKCPLPNIVEMAPDPQIPLTELYRIALQYKAIVRHFEEQE